MLRTPSLRIQSLGPSQQTEYCMRRSVIFELGYALPDLIAVLPAQHRVDQAMELGRQLLVGEWVLVMAGRICDFRDELGSIVEGDGHPVGDAGRVAGRELRVFDNRRAGHEVEQCRVREPLRW